MTEATSPEEPIARPRRRVIADLSPLRENPTYRRWWIGYAVSNIGSQLTIVAAQLRNAAGIVGVAWLADRAAKAPAR